MHMTQRHKDVRLTSSIIAIVAALLGVSGFNGGTHTQRTAEAASLSFASVPGIPEERSPESYQGIFLYRTAEDMLKALNVSYAREDKVVAFPDPALGLGSTVRVYRATPVTVKDGKSVKTFRTWTSTVKELLAERSVELEGDDKVVPALDSNLSPLNDGQTVVITRVSDVEIAVRQPIEIPVQTVNDDTLEKGTQTVQQAGSAGVEKLTYLVHREDGVEKSRNLIGQETTTAAIPKITKVGTKVIMYGTGGASWYQGIGSMTVAHKTLPMGTKMIITNLGNGKSVTVTVADRGPFIADRIVDLSKDAFAAISSLGTGVINVRADKVY